MAMLGREVLNPVTLIAQSPNEPIKLTVPYVTSFRNAMREAHSPTGYMNQRIRNTYSEKYFDKHFKGPAFAIDQHVWFYWPHPLVRQKNKKHKSSSSSSSSAPISEHSRLHKLTPL